MQYQTFAGMRISRLMLGTVQFGLPYGVANRSGQPDEKTVQEILSVALEGGVNSFDTAAAYGESEAVLGRALHALGVLDRVSVVTKINPLAPAQCTSTGEVRKAIGESLEHSRRRLQLDVLPVVLFHREADARYLDVLGDFKQKGWLLHAGVSCDNRPGPALDFATKEGVAALQIPANVLDRRHQQSGTFQTAARQGVAVFVRSVYLQGLLLMPEEQIPVPLQPVIPIRRRLANIAAEAGISLAECCLRSMLSREGVTSVLTGVETVEQMRENIELFGRGPLPPDLLAAVDEAVPELPERLITPALWPPTAKTNT